MTDHDPREGLDPRHPGGLIEGGPADIPGVQDRSAADAAHAAEQTEREGRTGQATQPAPADPTSTDSPG